ncbi:hypothetical protein Athai_08220 [Actinocatenispora thailandica]|uniref:Protein-glutamine gamma-glutamyltransferase-like C-terminal domain-containing protein n=1 Tax=Actinocatenispora thailandica TaxID=227318 RepID=A0A7R7HVX2_9ACTN|nr:DUF4129 domain-containing protein [Actinocatenispora thailandica]BCJ33319.1 hypothetical protein Athai_08220 [Actinocatenispora thailandica]
MSLSRSWTEFVADLADHVPGGVAGLAALVLLLAGLALIALYWRPRRRHRPEPVDPPATDEPAEAATDDEDDAVPELPPAQLASLADRYAAAGRYAEAVRERLRAMVRELVERGVLRHRPEWTVTELAAAAGAAAPGLAGTMTEAADVFSRIWYARRPATAADDARMRTLAAAVAERAGATR